MNGAKRGEVAELQKQFTANLRVARCRIMTFSVANSFEAE
jgi:hypothetical protein